MDELKIYIDKGEAFSAIVAYVVKNILSNHTNGFHFVNSSEKADLIWASNSNQSQPIAYDFYYNVSTEKILKQRDIFQNEALIHTNSEQIDYIATIFYLVNSLQEYGPNEDEIDRYGRFRYSASYQARFGIITKNLVRDLILEFLESVNIKAVSKDSKIFVSHDIDSMYGSLVQDGFWALKKGRLDIILKLIFQSFISRPEWRNIDRIMRLNRSYEIKSTFFWLVKKGRDEQGIKNADYDFSKQIGLINTVKKQNGFDNGLHKSTFDTSFDTELSMIPELKPINRYHFLKYSPHKDWELLSASPIIMDCSHGFAESFGFRNSYGFPFRPFSFQSKKEMDLLVVPLNFMDTTFSNYLDSDLGPADSFINFFEKNKTDSIISLLWHNNDLTPYKYKSYLEEYKKIASFIYETRIETFNSEDIIREYGDKISKSK